ncbi:hypothetical protein ACFL3S_02515 [Gemmatimonadota bacterium]
MSEDRRWPDRRADAIEGIFGKLEEVIRERARDLKLTFEPRAEAGSQYATLDLGPLRAFLRPASRPDWTGVIQLGHLECLIGTEHFPVVDEEWKVSTGGLIEIQTPKIQWVNISQTAGWLFTRHFQEYLDSFEEYVSREDRIVDGVVHVADDLQDGIQE